MAPRRYLQLPEAAQIARAPLKSIRRWIADGRLAHFRPGRRVLVREDDLLAYIEGKPQPSRERDAA
ncbi:MAG TPA: helix-turn-helix domain-containing protein [Polyangiaceae bacterium]|jgi:excisionase family DNA binding protein